MCAEHVTLAGIAAAIGLAVTITGAWKGLAEYSRNNSLRRFEKFQEMRKRRVEDERIVRFSKAIHSGAPEEVLSADWSDQYRFMSFYEEIALMVNSGLMREDIAFYMFGYDAMGAHSAEAFWHRVKRNDPYWRVFVEFCERMHMYRKRHPRLDWKVSKFKF